MMWLISFNSILIVLHRNSGMIYSNIVGKLWGSSLFCIIAIPIQWFTNHFTVVTQSYGIASSARKTAQTLCEWRTYCGIIIFIRQHRLLGSSRSHLCQCVSCRCRSAICSDIAALTASPLMTMSLQAHISAFLNAIELSEVGRYPRH